MTFEKMGDVLRQKDIDNPQDIIAFYDLVRTVVRTQSKVELESVRYRHEILYLTVANSLESSEIRLRRFQIEATLRKRGSFPLKRLTTRVL